MRKHILTVGAVVVVFSGIVGAMAIRPTRPSEFEPYKPTDPHHANILMGLENHAKLGAFHHVDIHPDSSYAVVWVDESFTGKPHSFQENSAKIAAGALVDLGRSSWDATIDIKRIGSDVPIGRYSWDSLKLY